MFASGRGDRGGKRLRVPRWLPAALLPGNGELQRKLPLNRKLENNGFVPRSGVPLPAPRDQRRSFRSATGTVCI